ncbi:MAG TPA: hypothetical protein VEB60_03355, partial [Candidatus Paceibacterota bacterium]|nr:hypothetical protein [Candidatus Paceibacterota bacterium]
GSPWTVTGYGFGPGEEVGFMVGSQTAGTARADSNGNFVYETTMPVTPSGAQTLVAKGVSSGTTASAGYTVAEVYPGLALGTYAGAPGESITFIGSGYLPNEPIQILTDRTGAEAVHSFTADASGSFSNGGWLVPNDFAAGELSLTIKGLHSFTEKTIVYYVTGR